jgi:hypothetical protein
MLVRRPAQRQVNRARTVRHLQRPGPDLGSAGPLGGAVECQVASEVEGPVRPGELPAQARGGVEVERATSQRHWVRRVERLSEADGAAANAHGASAADGIAGPVEIVRAAVKVEQGVGGNGEVAAMRPAAGEAQGTGLNLDRAGVVELDGDVGSGGSGAG